MLRSLKLRSLYLLKIGTNNFQKCSIISNYRFFYNLNDQIKFKSLLNTGLSINSQQVNCTQKRFKKGKKKKQGKEEQEEEDSDEDEIQKDDELESLLADEGVLVKDFQDVIIDIPNIRLDVVLKAGLPLTRAKVEEGFYEGRIRVNGDRVTKKNNEVSENDELDYILGRNPENNDLLDVKRIQILHLPDQMSSTGRTKLKVRRYFMITIENYPDPYESMVVRGPSKEEEFQSFKNKK